MYYHQGQLGLNPTEASGEKTSSQNCHNVNIGKGMHILCYLHIFGKQFFCINSYKYSRFFFALMEDSEQT